MARRSSAAQTLSKMYELSREAFDTAASGAGEFGQVARKWVPEHRGTVIAVSSVGAGACLVGYLLGRRRRARRSSWMEARGMQAPELDMAPFFKVLKLWMLYRVATRI